MSSSCLPAAVPLSMVGQPEYALAATGVVPVLVSPAERSVGVLDQLPNTQDPDPMAARLLVGWTGDLAGSKVGAVGAPDQGTAPTIASTPAPVLGIRGVARKRAAEIAFQAAHGARAPSSDEACAAQSPAPTEHSSKRKRASASDLCQAQNRNRAADCRSSFRQRTTETTLETAQQEARDSAAKVEFLKACFAEEACGAFVLALFDQFCAR
jgi:hypothetical protein